MDTTSKYLILLSHGDGGEGLGAWPAALGSHKPGPTCRSALGGTIGYLHPSSGNPASSLRKEKLQVHLCRVTQPWLGRPLGVRAVPHLRQEVGGTGSLVPREQTHPQLQVPLLYRNSHLSPPSAQEVLICYQLLGGR